MPPESRTEQSLTIRMPWNTGIAKRQILMVFAPAPEDRAEMDRLPQTPEERARFDAFIDKWEAWAKVVAGLIPVVLFAPVWWRLRHALGPEGAALIVIVTQIFLVIVAADRAVFALARWDMYWRRVRKSQL